MVSSMGVSRLDRVFAQFRLNKANQIVWSLIFGIYD
jgi:hypothetical protein